ncbi:hypothetical protein ACA910_005854 [Epithemia clementina (nom. ined.)]
MTELATGIRVKEEELTRDGKEEEDEDDEEDLFGGDEEEDEEEGSPHNSAAAATVTPPPSVTTEETPPPADSNSVSASNSSVPVIKQLENDTTSALGAPETTADEATTAAASKPEPPQLNADPSLLLSTTTESPIVAAESLSALPTSTAAVVKAESSSEESENLPVQPQPPELVPTVDDSEKNASPPQLASAFSAATTVVDHPVTHPSTGVDGTSSSPSRASAPLSILDDETSPIPRKNNPSLSANNNANKKHFSGTRFGLDPAVKIPQSVDTKLLEGSILAKLKSLPPNLANDALQEYDDALQIKGGSIRNQGAYLFGVIKRYVSVQDRANSGEGPAILPMGEGLTPVVNARLETLVTSGFCTRDEMNEKVKSKIRMLSEKDALFAIDELSSAERSTIRNFGSYFMGILNRYMRGDTISRSVETVVAARPTRFDHRTSNNIQVHQSPLAGMGMGRGAAPPGAMPRGNDRNYRDKKQPHNLRERSRDRFENMNDRMRYGGGGGGDRGQPARPNRPWQPPHKQPPMMGFNPQQQMGNIPGGGMNMGGIPPPPPPPPMGNNNYMPQQQQQQTPYMPQQQHPPNQYGGQGFQSSNAPPPPQMGHNMPPQQQRPPNMSQQQQTYTMAQQPPPNNNFQHQQQQQHMIGNPPGHQSFGMGNQPQQQQPPPQQQQFVPQQQQHSFNPMGASLPGQMIHPHQQQQAQLQQDVSNSYGHWPQQQHNPQPLQSQLPVDILALADKASSALASQNKMNTLPGIIASSGVAPSQLYSSNNLSNMPGPPPPPPSFNNNNNNSGIMPNPYGPQPPSHPAPGSANAQHHHQQRNNSSSNNSSARPPRHTIATLQDLPTSVQYAVQNLVSTGQVEKIPDEGIMGMIFDLPESLALGALQKFTTIDKTGMRSRIAYLAGVLRRELEKINKR